MPGRTRVAFMVIGAAMLVIGVMLIAAVVRGDMLMLEKLALMGMGTLSAAVGGVVGFLFGSKE